MSPDTRPSDGPGAIVEVPDTIAEEAEITVLGSMMLDPGAADRALRILRPGDLERPPNRAIFESIARLRGCGQAADPMAVKLELEEAGLLDAAGGEDHLARIVEIVPTSSNLTPFARRLVRRAVERNVRGALERGRNLRGALEGGLGRLEAVDVAEGGVRVVTLADVLAEGVDQPRAIVPRLLFEGRVVLLAGREKSGKSTLAAAAAAAVSAGMPFLGEEVERGRVLIVGLDEHLGDTARRLVQFGADPEEVLLADRLTQPLRGIEELVATVEPRLVVVDALANLAAIAGIEEPHAATGWVPLLGGLARVARDSGTAFALLHHARKSDGSYRDSSAIGAGVDAVLELHSVEEDIRARQIRGAARWPFEPFTIRLYGDLGDGALQWKLTAGELSLDHRVFEYVLANPGCSKRSVRDAVTGRSVVIDDALRKLERRGSIRIEAGGYVAEAARTRSGTRSTEEIVSGGNPHGHATDTVRTHIGRVPPCPNPQPPKGVGTRTVENGDQLEAGEL